MKFSQYNNFIYFSNKNILYNVLLDKYIILEHELFELLKIANKDSNIKELTEIHPDLVDYLIAEGFIIPNDKNEFNEVVEFSKKIDNNEQEYLLFINPTMNCNFKCWYCYETHVKDSKMDENTINNTINYIQNIIRNNDKIKTFVLSWFGGEPLLYFSKVIVPIMNKAKEILDMEKIALKTAFTTNGLLIDLKIIEFLKKYDVQELQITLDGYKDNHDKIRFISEKKGSFDKIIENIILLTTNKLNVAVRINCTEKNMNDIDSVMNLFENIPENNKKYLRFTFHKVWQLESSLEDDVRYYIDKYLEKGLKVNGAIHDTVRGSCYADKINQAFLNYNGDIFKCSARDFNEDSREGVLTDDGVIVWNDKNNLRLNSKFQNEPCKTCSILPICGGGCSQLSYENLGKDYCVNDYDPIKKNEIVKRVFAGKIFMNA